MFAAKTVTAKFTNGTTKPSGSIAINSGAAATNSPNVTVTLAPKDITGSGIGYYCLSNTAITTCNWTSSFDYNAPNKPWTLAGTDGVKTVYALFRDNAGNVSTSITDTILLDTTAPTGSVKINGGAAQTATAAVTLTLAATDGTGSGVATLSYSTDSGVTWSIPEAFVASKKITLTSGDGVNTVQVKFTDKAGNTSGAYIASIKLDTTLPSGDLQINGGAKFTNKTAVTLGLSSTDAGGIAGVCISNIPTCTAWLTYAATKSWTLSTGDGLKTVYFQFKDTAGNTSAQDSRTITLDTTKPVDSINNFTAIPSGDNTLNLTWYAATDPVSVTSTSSGIKQYNLYYGATATPACSGAPLATVLDGQPLSYIHTGLSAAKTCYYRVCAVDNAGNFSIGKTASSKPTDITPPTAPQVTINGGADYTNNKTVTLGLGATDAGGIAGVCISNIPTCTAWLTYAATKSWTFSPGDELKHVYVQYKDTAGNTSAQVNSTITLDATKPVDGSTNFSADNTVSDNTVSNNALKLTWSAATDPVSVTSTSSGIKQYNLYYGATATPACSGAPLATVLAGQPLSYTHTGLSAAKTCYYRVCAVDNAGNFSTGKTASNKPTDTTPPTNPQVTINGGADYTNKTTVTLGLGATDAGGIAGVCISNKDPNITPCTAWLTYAATKSWTLSPSDELKHVYVQYKDTAGNTSVQASSTITLDTTKPTGSITINGGTPSYTNDKEGKVTVNLNATDGAGSGVASYCLSNTAITTCGSWTPLASYPADITGWTLSTGQGLKTVYAQFKDAAGNLSAVVNAKITLDNIAPALTITTTLPDTTSLTSKVINGSKEANSKLGISLNGSTIDTSTITTASTTWSVTVGSFSEANNGLNTIIVTATDADLNVTTKTLTITYAPFKLADLNGTTWRIVNASATDAGAWTGYGTLTFNDQSGGYTGTWVDNYKNSFNIDGNLTLDLTGTITGGVINVNGGQITISQGAMDINRSMFSLLAADTGTSGNQQLLTAVKTGSGFTLADIVGKWYMYDVTAATPTYSSIVGLGTMVFADNGDISSGSLTDTFKSINGSTTVKTVSTFTITGYNTVADDGGTGGPATLYSNQAYWSVNTDMGQISSQKNISIVRSSETYSGAFSNKFILVKDGGSFSTADLNGRWYIEAMQNNTANFGIFGGYIDIAAGKVIGGQTRNVGNEITHITGGTLTITPAGTFTGSVITSDGTQSITAGKLDSTKSIMTIMAGDTLLIGYLQR